MASEAQVLANRRNAEKSTGPRTVEGKAVASQNAVRHGLLAERCVIRTEDPEEFDAFREQMLGELDPAGPIETVLAERIVSLSWRLKRAERMQNEALDCLLAQDGVDSGGESGELGSFEQAGDPALGRVAVKDFGHERALERLMVYERRIEHSLYRTMNELHRMKLLRPFDADEIATTKALAATVRQPGETNPMWGGVNPYGVACGSRDPGGLPERKVVMQGHVPLVAANGPSVGGGGSLCHA